MTLTKRARECLAHVWRPVGRLGRVVRTVLVSATVVVLLVAVVAVGWGFQRNVWFDRADLRGALALGCLLECCSFRHSRLTDVQLQQGTIRRCQFAGALKDVP